MNIKQPVDWVDPLIDTANRRFFFLTTASHPFGMVNLSPDTRVGQEAWGSGYRYDDDHVHWFSHVHAWQLCGIPVMPTMGELKGHLGSEAYRSCFSHDDEAAKPGYHAVTLDDYGIRAELTATCRVGLHRYTFDRDGDAWIIFGLGETIMLPMSDCFVEQEDNRTFSGFVENERTRRRPKRTKIFFDATFDRDVEEVRAWRDGVFEPFHTAMAGPGIGMALRMRVKAGDVVQLKLAISYCGRAQARRNREIELVHWDFDRVRLEARETWNQWLGRIEVEGGSDAQKTKFYTDLFHALKGRRRVSDADGSYLDNTGDLPVVRQIPSGRGRASSLRSSQLGCLLGRGVEPQSALVAGLARGHPQLLQHAGRHVQERRLDPAWPIGRQLHLCHDQPDLDNLSGLCLDDGHPHLRHRHGLRGHAQEPRPAWSHGQGRL